MKINQLKAGVILSYASVIVGTVVSLFYTPAMLRILGQSEFGLYTIAGSTVAYLNLLNFGFTSSYVRFYSRYRIQGDEKAVARLNGMFISVFAIIGMIAVMAGGILVANTGNIFGAKLSADEIKITKILMALLVINIAASFPASVFVSYLTANEQYFFQRILNLVKSVASPFLSLIVLMLGFRSIGMVCITVIVNISIDITYMLFCFKKIGMKFSFHNLDWSLLKEIASFSVFIFINMVVDQINWNVDKFLLGIYHGSIATAVYGLAAQMNTCYQQFSTMISSVFIPRVHRLVVSNDNKSVSDLFTRVGRIQFFVLALICSGFVFFGHPFMLKWGGNKYGDSYYIAMLLMIPVTVPLMQNIGIEVQRAMNLHKYRSYIYLGIAIVNIIISIPLCRLWGGIGCAIGTAVAIIIGNIVIMNILYHKMCKIDMFAFWRNIANTLVAFIFPIICGVLLCRFVDIYKTVNLIICIAIYTAVYLLSIWHYGLNDYEKGLIIKPVTRILHLGKQVGE